MKYIRHWNTTPTWHIHTMQKVTIYFLPAVVVPYSELVQIVRLIPLENYVTICTTLSPPQSHHYQASPTPTEEKVVAALTEWHRQSPSNRREKMARILLRMPGCYRAAIKLDPKGYQHLSVVKHHQTQCTCVDS